MPRLPINYSNTIIYKLVCNDINITDIYVGHTTDFIRRKANHKCSCNNENNKKYNYYVYQFIRNNGGFENWSMIEIEKYSCNDAHEATARERHWLETLGATLNILIPARTEQEWKETNKDRLDEYHQEYYQANKEQISEKNKEKIICECGSIVIKRCLLIHRKSKKHLKYLDNLNNLI